MEITVLQLVWVAFCSSTVLLTPDITCVDIQMMLAVLPTFVLDHVVVDLRKSPLHPKICSQLIFALVIVSAECSQLFLFLQDNSGTLDRNEFKACLLASGYQLGEVRDLLYQLATKLSVSHVLCHVLLCIMLNTTWEKYAYCTWQVYTA